MLPADEDRNLASQIAKGVERAIEVFDNIYRDELERACRSRGLSVEDSKDIVQETMVGAINLIQRGQFRGQSSLRTLLFSILRKKIVDHLRKESAAEFLPIDSSTSNENSTTLARIEDIPGPLTEPATKLIAEQALQRMPEEHRLILLMNQMGGYTIEEIGQIVRRPTGSVGRMLAEAKKIFRNNVLDGEER